MFGVDVVLDIKLLMMTMPLFVVVVVDNGGDDNGSECKQYNIPRFLTDLIGCLMSEAIPYIIVWWY